MIKLQHAHATFTTEFERRNLAEKLATVFNGRAYSDMPYSVNTGDTATWSIDSGNNAWVDFEDDEPNAFILRGRYNDDQVSALADYLVDRWAYKFAPARVTYNLFEGVSVSVIGESGAFNGTFQEDPANPEELVEGIERLVLSQACAGIDVSAPAYISALRTTLENLP